MCWTCRRKNPQRAAPVRRLPPICQRCGTSTTNRSTYRKRFCDDCRPLNDADRRKAHWNRRRQLAGECDLTGEAIRELREGANRCPLCSVTMTRKPLLPASMEIDHIVPLNVGGTSARANLRVICRACNKNRPLDGSDYTGPVLPEMINLAVARQIAEARAKTVDAVRKARVEQFRQARAARRAAEAQVRDAMLAEIVGLREAGLRWKDIAVKLGFKSVAGPCAYLRDHGVRLPVVRYGDRGAHSWGAYKR